METPVTCCGIELRRREEREALGGTRVVLSGSRGDLSIRIEAVVGADGALASCYWEGAATVTVRWTGPNGPAGERGVIATSAGSTPQGCADTLAEMVRSVAAALAGVAG